MKYIKNRIANSDITIFSILLVNTTNRNVKSFFLVGENGLFFVLQRSYINVYIFIKFDRSDGNALLLK